MSSNESARAIHILECMGGRVGHSDTRNKNMIALDTRENPGWFFIFLREHSHEI